MNKNLILLSFTAFLIMFTGQAKADIVYSNIFGTPGYSSNSGWLIGTPLNYEQGESFTPTANYTLTNIELAAGNIYGTNSINVQLMNDNSGQPGSILESFSFSSLGPFGSTYPLLSANSVLDPTLDAGKQYWLVASPPDSSSAEAWNWNIGNYVEPLATSQDNGTTWNIGSPVLAGAFLVEGTPVGVNPVPEPSSLALFAMALLAGGMILRKKLNFA
ncbi:MAG: PEP-CTERM sorting domain-containing protein [Candidatus Omnitrophica bacterium]|nr:PEP-CTERM sorting domain-containing protein [Candidatus Omnitrophota bacterium]